MRRPLSFALVLLFWLTPLAALLPASQDTSLPMCCRRHGAHHCAMASETTATTSGSHAVSAPSHCPLYHQFLPATIPLFLAPLARSSQAAAQQPLRPAGASQAFFSETSLAHSGRAPPPAC